jgi:hypothetical protein
MHCRSSENLLGLQKGHCVSVSRFFVGVFIKVKDVIDHCFFVIAEDQTRLAMGLLVFNSG